MKTLCKNCSKNVNGICEVYLLEVEEFLHSCPFYEIYVDGFSIEERVGYDMGMVDEILDSELNS